MSDKENDTLSVTERKQQKVDSLRKYLRNEFYKNNYDKTIEIGKNVLQLAREIDDYKTVFSISSLIGNSFMKIEDTLQARSIFEETIEEAKKIQQYAAIDSLSEDNYNVTRSLITAQIDLGNFYALQDKAAPAIKIFKEAIPIAEQIKDTSHLFIINFNIAELNLNQKNIPEAEYYVQQTNKLVSDDMVEAYRAVAKINHGKLEYLKNNPSKAIKLLKEGIEMAQNSGYTDPLIEGYDYYAKASALNGNYSQAYRWTQKADSLRSEKYQVDKIAAIQAATAKYKLNEYEQELKSKELQNEINQQNAKRETTIFWVKIASGILLLSTIFLLISYVKRRRLLKNLIEKNKQYLIAKEESEESAKAKTKLFSNITHELRTPMYGIIGTSSLMMKDKNLKGHDENLKSLKFSANYLLSLINNVLQLTKIDTTKKDELHQIKFNIRELVHNAIESSKYINTQNPSTYEVEVDPTIPEYVIGDDLKISQILINLIGNATKFTNNGIISLKLTSGEIVDHQIPVHFSIVDTGVGISEERQKEIFNEFSQFNISQISQGAGLGLPIVKKLLELHESDISLQSEVGKGTQVDFTIRFEVEENANLNPIPETIDENALAGFSILVVDDNKINQIVTKKTLKNYGASITVAGSGAEAIELVKNESFDLILMDINMPEMNGFEATEIIRGFNSEIPILALTAVELEKVVGDNSYHLMNGFVLKPYKINVFIDTILKSIPKKTIL